MRSVLFIHLYQLQLFQHLHTALHLEGFRISTLEALDEVLGLLDHLLLFLPLLHLLLMTLCAKLEILRIRHLIIIDSAHRNFNGARCNVVHKLTVVTNHHHCLTVANQEVFKPTDRLDVQVVRWLVEKEHVGILEQQLCQLDAHAPTSGELARLAVEVRAFKTQTEQRLFHVFLKVGEVDGVKLLAHRCYLLNEFHVGVALIVGALRKFLIQRFNLRLHLVEVGKSL